jgi:hypothetical protein
MTIISLNSGPLSLVTQQRGAIEADACKQWLAGHLARGTRVVVPEIVEYELRRELLRAKKTRSLKRLDVFIAADHFIFLQHTLKVGSTARCAFSSHCWSGDGLCRRSAPRQSDVNPCLRPHRGQNKTRCGPPSRVESRGGAVTRIAPFPPPAHRTGRADLPHPALGEGSRFRMRQAAGIPLQLKQAKFLLQPAAPLPIPVNRAFLCLASHHLRNRYRTCELIFR